MITDFLWIAYLWDSKYTKYIPVPKTETVDVLQGMNIQEVNTKHQINRK